MTKEEWIEAFKAINNRIPTAQEFQEAKLNREFSEANPSETAIEELPCPKCHALNITGSTFCPNCGTRMDGSGNSTVDAANSFVDGIAKKIDSVTGGEGTVELRMRDLFSEVFKSHTRQEAENIFACGSESTTPRPEDISKEWPKPWYFARVFGLLLVSTLLLHLIYSYFNGLIAIPGLLFVSSMTGAIPVLFFLFECNSPRNIDIMSILELFFLGGILSIIITFFFNLFVKAGTGHLGAAFMTGIVEELAKLLVTAFFIKRMSNKRYILNGLLLGGAVGAGFDVFESAGYNFLSMYELDWAPEVFLQVTLLRGLLTGIAAHVAWGAMTGAGIMMVLKKHKTFSWNLLWSGESLSFLTISILLHALWDTTLPVNDYIKITVLSTVAFITIMIIINRGLKEINDLGQKYEAE